MVNLRLQMQSEVYCVYSRRDDLKGDDMLWVARQFFSSFHVLLKIVSRFIAALQFDPLSVLGDDTPNLRGLPSQTLPEIVHLGQTHIRSSFLLCCVYGQIFRFWDALSVGVKEEIANVYLPPVPRSFASGKDGGGSSLG